MIIKDDAKSRNSIISDIQKNLFVEAGAGSGKTTMLVNRMVAMVEAGIPVEKICAITFTKNAALEFYKRFQSLLIDRSNPSFQYQSKGFAGELPAPDDKSRELCANALKNIDLCFMGTIDAFCKMVLTEHPAEANIPFDGDLIGSKEELDYYRSFYADSRLGRYGQRLKDLATSFAIMQKEPQEAFAICMKEVMDRRNIHFNFQIESELDPAKVFAKEEKGLRKALGVFARNYDTLSVKINEDKKETKNRKFFGIKRAVDRGINAGYDNYLRALKDCASLSLAGTKEDYGFSNECVVRERAGNIVLNVSSDDKKEAEDYQLLINRMKTYRYNVTMMFLTESLLPLSELMNRQGKFTFFDYIYYLRNMLRDDIDQGSKLINYIYKRHSYFLIDEFQDTNPIQSEIFFYLSSEKPEKDFAKCQPRPGSLFIVGDPKQSIYRFRNADVTSYLKIKGIFNDGVGDVLYLTNNFRSRNILKNYFNDVFTETIKEDEEHNQSDYLEIANTTSDEPQLFEGIFTYESYTEKLVPAYPEMSDAKRIADIIEGLVDNPSFYIEEKGDRRRHISYSDFMVIAIKKKMDGIIEEFKERGIPVRVEGKVLFDRCEGLRTIVAIIKAVYDTSDIISLVETLKSPLFAFSNADLLEYQNTGGKLRIDSCPLEDDTGISKAINSLSRLLEYREESAAGLFERIMDDFEIFKYLSSEGLEIIYYSLELLKNAQSSSEVVTHEDAIAFLDELIAGESDLERCLSLKKKADVVHIANLHKVKGLEAPIVILAQSNPSSFPTDPSIRVEHGTNGSEGWIIKVKKDKFTNYIENKGEDVEAIKAKEKLAGVAENARLVYVAATRARNVLITNYSMQNGKEGKLRKAANFYKPLVEKTEGGDIFELISNDGPKKKPLVETIEAASRYEEVHIVANDQPSYCKQSPSTLKASSKYAEEQLPMEGVDEYHDNGESYATIIGTMVHRLMEMIIISNNSLSAGDLADNIIAEYLTDEFSSYQEKFRSILLAVHERMNNGGYQQINGAKDDLLPIILKAKEAVPEIPFTYLDNGILWNGIIDLLYLDDEGYHIIDWKTNKSGEGLKEHYEPQLQSYQKAIKELMGVDVVDALIYHIAIK